MSEIKQPCLVCGDNISYPDSLIGKTIDCPHCGATVELQGDERSFCPLCEEKFSFPKVLLGTLAACPHCEAQITLSGRESPCENATDPPEEADIFLLHNDQQCGPYTKSQLIQYLSDGSVMAGAMAMRSTMPSWVALREWREFRDACQRQKSLAEVEPAERLHIRRRVAGSTIIPPGFDELGAKVKEIKHGSAWIFMTAIAWVLGDHLPESGSSWNIPPSHTITLHIFLGAAWIICGYALFNCHLDSKNKHITGLILPFVAWLIGTIGSDPVFSYMFAPGHSYSNVAAIPSIIILLLIWLSPFIYLPFASDSLLHKTIHTCRKLHACKGRGEELWSAFANCTMCFITVLLVSCDSFDATIVVTKSLGLDFIYVRIILFGTTFIYRQLRYSQLENQLTRMASAG